VINNESHENHTPGTELNAFRNNHKMLCPICNWLYVWALLKRYRARFERIQGSFERILGSFAALLIQGVTCGVFSRGGMGSFEEIWGSFERVQGSLERL